MEIREEHQLNPVADEVSAITAVVMPILTGVLYSLKKDIADELGGYENVPLKMLARNHRPGDGDTGICFEYAVHDAVRRGEASVEERVADALKICKISDGNLNSILFGVEKAGNQQLIETATELLTPESRLLTGRVGQPPLLKRHIASAATAFRTRGTGSRLPQSIEGLWKADLFLGNPMQERWVGATVKINPSALKGARGLRVGLVPASQGKSDSVKLDEKNNLVVCPIPYDGAFVEVFYMAWEVASSFITADARVPREVNLPRPAARQVARYLEDRRDYPVLQVVEALQPLSQRELIQSEVSAASVVQSGGKKSESTVSAILAPNPTGL